MKQPLIKVCGLLCFILTTQVSLACVTCNRKIQEAIFNSTFYPNLFVMLLPFLVLGGVVWLLAAWATARHKKRAAANPDKELFSAMPLTATAAILGVGVGGFIDGILLHQILQWHEMISNKLPPTNFISKSVNMFWDGIFHAFTLGVTVTGIILLWKLLYRQDINRSGYLFSGGLVMGWALFNLIEGIADHHLLKLHNVRETTTHVAAWNYGFLGFSVVLLLGSLVLINRGSKEQAL